jgi:ABC-type transporter Mla subunit MlaD
MHTSASTVSSVVRAYAGSIDPTEEIVSELVPLEARLRDLAYDALRRAAEDGDAVAREEERRLNKARRAVEKAIRDLGGEPEGAW